MGHLSARGVTVSIGSTPLLRDLELDVAEGEFIAIVGPNGVGKTTLLRTLAGLRSPDAGIVTLDGRPTCTMTAHQRALAIALLSHDGDTVDGLSVSEAVTIGRYAHHPWWDWRRNEADEAAVCEALQRVGLLPFASRPLADLSSGERARVFLAVALAQDAGTLLLDEPTSHLDVRFAHEVLALLAGIAQSGRTVVAVLHDLNEAAAYAQRIAVLAPGRILCYGKPRTALAPGVLAASYGMPFEALETPSGYRVLAAATEPSTLRRGE